MKIVNSKLKVALTKHNKGTSLLEIIVAVAIFGLISSAMVSMVIGGLGTVSRGGRYTEAEALAQEAIEAVRSIRDGAWNEIVYNQSAIATSSDEWIFSGEGTTEQIGIYTRTISFSDVCRNSLDDIVDCPGDYVDVHSKKVTVVVEWEVRSGVINTIKRVSYLTDWDSNDWVQTDWSGGNGQSIWSDNTMYDSDDGNIDMGTLGEIKLKNQGRSCSGYTWEFDNASDYVYNSGEIEVIESGGGKAQLKDIITNGYLEVGKVTVNNNWTLVNLQQTYTNPVIVTFGEEKNNTLPNSPRLRNVGSNSFEVRLQSATSPEQSLSTENLYYMVVEEGSFTLGSTKIEAHRYETNTTSSKAGGWNGDLKNYSQTYSSPPIVLHQAMTYNDPSWVTTFVSSDSSITSPPTATAFQISLNKSEAGTTHGTETIGWIAIEGNITDIINGIDFETYITSDSLRGYGTSAVFNFSQTYSSPPIVIGSQQEMDGNNGGWMMANNITSSQIDLYVDEDQIGDSERNHTTETGAYIAFSGAFSVNLGQTTSYSTNNPTINPASSSQNIDNLGAWQGFVETATKNGGEIYYQLSDDDGTTWYYWNGSSWTVAGAGQYNTADVINANIFLFSATNKKIMFRAFLESDGSQQVQLDSITVNCGNLQIEVGSVSTDENWTTVNLNNAYSHPVIVASYQETNNTLPASVRIRNSKANSFEIRLQNPSGSNLSNDKIIYLVMEEGVWILDGIKIEAHKYDTNTVGSKGNWSYDVKTYNHSFSTNPIVLHQVMTYNDPNWITTYVSSNGSRSSPPGISDFAIALNGAEAVSSHGTETIGWIAIERDSTGIIEGTDFETYRTSDSVQGHDNGCNVFSYQNTYSVAPLVLTFQEEMDGNDGSWGVLCSNSATQAGLHCEEDQVSDSDRSHTTETFSFIAFSAGFNYASGIVDTYAISGYLLSSAFDTGKNSNVNIIEWDEITSSCFPSCGVKFQLRTAPDSGGSPGVWTNWYGENGPFSYFTASAGSLISLDLNNNQWMQYNIELYGDGRGTPTMEEVRLNYK